MSLWSAKVDCVITPRLAQRTAAWRPVALWALFPTLVLSPLASGSTPLPSPDHPKEIVTPSVTAPPAAPARVVLPIAARSAPVPSPSSGRPQSTVAPTVSNSPAPPAPAANPGSISAAVVESHLATIDATLQKIAAKPDKSAWISATGAFLGVLLGAIVTFVTQTRLLLHQQSQAERAAEQARQLADAKAAQERELASRRAALEIGNSFVQWQLKQLSELYGPLHALLGQSNALYTHMNRVLVARDPAQFRFANSIPANTPPRPSMEIYYQGRWVVFRTLLHIDKVYGQGHGVEDYFSEIVATGDRMVKIINEKAGYIRPDQNELPEVFGRYLAHYSVLKRLYDHIRARSETLPRETDDIWSSGSQRPPIAVIEAAVFPREIDGLVTAGFIAIREELNAWRAKAGNA